METQLIFENWKCRCSSLGNIMTNLDGITTKQIEELNSLQQRKEDAKKGDAKPLTQNMEDKLKELIAKRDKPDELPAGAISWLEEEFRHKFWGRRRILQNKYLDKGLMCEEDALQLLSDVDGTFYYKNDEQLENDYLTGCPDNRQDKIRDTKANYDLESFDKADLISLYGWQIKGYCFLDSKPNGELDYCLVNNPIHQIYNELKRAATSKGFDYYLMDEYAVRLEGLKIEVSNAIENGSYASNRKFYKDQEAEILKLTDLFDMLKQIEKNMIFDIPVFQEDHPEYNFINTDLDFSIPKHLRVKKFEVTLEDGDIENIIRRVKLARYWLREKELETLIKIKQV